MFQDPKNGTGRGSGRARGGRGGAGTVDRYGGRNRNGSLSPFSVDSSSGSELNSPPHKFQRLSPIAQPGSSFSPDASTPRVQSPRPQTEVVSPKQGTMKSQRFHRVTLTLSLRRPPRFMVPMYRTTGEAFEIQDGKRLVKTRQGTGKDFCGDHDGRQVLRRVPEMEAGLIGVEGEQEQFKVCTRHSAKPIL